MLLKFTRYDDIDEKKLMGVYIESNTENTAFICPGEMNQEKALKFVEKGFLNYLKSMFFTSEENTYWVLADKNKYLCACRTTEIRKGFYYLEALETIPDERNKGYGTKLLTFVTQELKKAGPFKLCSCVGKSNTLSLKTHQKCGFRIISDMGINYITDEPESRSYSLEYKYEK